MSTFLPTGTGTGDAQLLSPLELLVLAAILDLGEGLAIGPAVHERVRKLAEGLELADSSTHHTLNRLERKGLVSSTRTDWLLPVKKPCRRYFRLEAEGERSYEANLRVLRRLLSLPEISS